MPKDKDEEFGECPDDDPFCINSSPIKKGNIAGNKSPLSNMININNVLNIFAGSVWDDCYGVIYLITDTNKDKSLDNIKVYIGQTIQALRKRFYDDLNSPSNKYLKAAVERYNKKFKIIEIDRIHYRTLGGELSIEVIKKCKDSRELNKSERKEIKKYKSYIPKYHKFIRGKIIPLYGYNLYKGGGGRMPLRGRLHPFYIHINKDALKDLIVSGYLTYEIANEFGVNRAVINHRIKEFWGHQGMQTLKDVRAKFGGQEIYIERKKQIVDESRHIERIKKFYLNIDASLLDELLEEDSSSLDIDEIFLEKLIFNGYKKKKRFKTRQVSLIILL